MVAKKYGNMDFLLASSLRYRAFLLALSLHKY